MSKNKMYEKWKTLSKTGKDKTLNEVANTITDVQEDADRLKILAQGIIYYCWHGPIKVQAYNQIRPNDQFESEYKEFQSMLDEFLVRLDKIKRNTAKLKDPKNVDLGVAQKAIVNAYFENPEAFGEAFNGMDGAELRIVVIDAIKKAINKFKDENGEIVKCFDEINTEYKKNRDSLAVSAADMERIEKEIKDSSNTLNEASKRLRDLDDELLKQRREFINKQDQININKTEIEKLEKQNAEQEERIRELKKLTNNGNAAVGSGRKIVLE